MPDDTETTTTIPPAADPIDGAGEQPDEQPAAEQPEPSVTITVAAVQRIRELTHQITGPDRTIAAQIRGQLPAV